MGFKEDKKMFINFLKQMNMIQKVFAFIFFLSFFFSVDIITSGENIQYINTSLTVSFICFAGYFFFKDYK